MPYILRLRKRAIWSEFSLVVHARRYIFPLFDVAAHINPHLSVAAWSVLSAIRSLAKNIYIETNTQRDGTHVKKMYNLSSYVVTSNHETVANNYLLQNKNRKRINYTLIFHNSTYAQVNYLITGPS